MAEPRAKRSQLSKKAPFWREFFILLGAGTLGVVAVIPYQVTLLGGLPEEISIPFPLLLLLGILQNMVLLALTIGMGLLCARKVGLGAPILEGWLRGEEVGKRGRPILIPSVLVGLGVGLFIIVLEMAIFAPHLPTTLQETEPPTPWQGFLASFYGGIDEEILLRLFVVSLLAWLLSRVWKDAEGKPTVGGCGWSSSWPVYSLAWVICQPLYN